MIDKIKSAFYNEIPLESIEHSIRHREMVTLDHFTGSSLSLFLSAASDFASHILVITPDIEKSASLLSDLREMNSSINPSLFPPLRRKAYDDQKILDLSVMVQRSEVLEQIKTDEKTIVITTSDAVCEKLISAEEFDSGCITLQKSESVSPEELKNQLVDQGYKPARFVDEPGEFAQRGGILDVYPFSGNYPVRLEFFGNEIESIREFDPDSQRSIAFLNETRFIPNAAFETDESKQSLFDYLPGDTVFLIHEPDLVKNDITQFFDEATKLYQAHQDNDLPQPDHEFLLPSDYDKALNDHPIFISGSFKETLTGTVKHIALRTAPHPELNGSFKLLRSYIKDKSRDEILTMILCDNQNQRERFEDLLGEPSTSFNYLIGLNTLHEGFELPGQHLSILTDHQIFNRYHRPKIQVGKSSRKGISFKELKDLNVGDYVVHVDYGIGKFAGFKKIDVKNVTQEAAVLHYQNDSILYVNVTSLHKLQKYSGKEGTAPRVTRLGSGDWAKKKARTKSKVKDIARELIDLYARRKTSEAFAFSQDTTWQKEMEARFEFEETPDQLSAIQAVKKDMESDQPMDRLICGDVGFGKTEVALRAAFKAVMNQKQVAVLVPTTILADQHYNTFVRRMEDYPVHIELISRFRTASEQKKVISELKSGQVDILIGTHRLVSKDVVFKDLGLLIIDEEQRFGVTVKEKLKEFRTSVDVLTMTATPIPRTMQFSLMGARDLSIITTPPTNRQPVYTEIHSFNQELIRDAILKETSRGGQIFFIHNRIKNIEEVTDLIRMLVPDIRVRFGHGQMPPAKLEKIINDFYQNKFDVLVSTNIVENGIDIANANTIIINRANHFGLSELHQLRGRVGRSMRKAFCYLLTPPIETLTNDARKRLQALEQFSDLGSGFNIAMRDLDIRGAGDILGAEQSGFVNELGFELYTKILDDAVRELKEQEYGDLFKQEPHPHEYPDTTVEFDLSALLESDYVSDNVERLNLYRKLASASTMEQIDEFHKELKDRFGTLPASAKNLIIAARIKWVASRLFIRKITIRSNRIWMICPENDSTSGKEFYQSGKFQNLLETIVTLKGDSYNVVQKKNTVRLVIEEIKDIDSALDFLEKLVTSDAFTGVQV